MKKLKFKRGGTQIVENFWKSSERMQMGKAWTGNDTAVEEQQQQQVGTPGTTIHNHNARGGFMMSPTVNNGGILNVNYYGSGNGPPSAPV